MQQEELITLNSATDMLKQKVLRLNFELGESQAKTKNEIDEVKSKSKKEIKAWRKELGEERRKTIKLEQELKATNDKTVEEENPLPVDTEPLVPSNPVEERIECTICAEPIHNYEPDYFNGVEMNPECENCKTQSVKSEIQSEELNNGATEIDSFPDDDGVDRENLAKLDKVRRVIRLKVKLNLKSGPETVK